MKNDYLLLHAGERCVNWGAGGMILVLLSWTPKQFKSTYITPLKIHV